MKRKHNYQIPRQLMKNTKQSKENQLAQELARQ